MTIVTKPLSDKKQDQLKKPLVVAGASGNDVDVESVGDPRYITPGRVHRVSTATLVAIFLISLLFLGLGVIGGLYFYRNYALSQSHRVQGWFQIPKLKDSQASLFGQSFESPEALNALNAIADSTSISEEFDIDLNDDVEKINVPRFDQGRRGRFIHDFNANKTGIVDLEGKRCFVMPLNRSRVMPPRSMYDLFVKILDGYFEVDTNVVRETYHVTFPPITAIEDMGMFIYRECSGLPTYRLQRWKEPVVKRSTAVTEEFREFAGNKVTNYKILMDNVIEYERDHPSH